MKLVMVTAVEEFQNDVLKLFKRANIESFSGSEIEGYKSQSDLLATSTWFPSIRGASESVMFFHLPKTKTLKAYLNLLVFLIKKLKPIIQSEPL